MLDWIYSIVANYGWSIVIFTVLIKVVLMPLDIKNRKGMRKMAQIQPELNKLQKKYISPFLWQAYLESYEITQRHLQQLPVIQHYMQK